VTATEIQDYAAQLNLHRDGFCTAMDLHFVKATASEVVIEWQLGPQHRQVYGIVHGGVYCGVIETAASVGAALSLMPDDKSPVGLENNTTFIKAVREGKLRATGRPLTRGRKTQVWEVEIRNETAQLIASGRVRLLCLEAGHPVGGEHIPRAKAVTKK